MVSREHILEQARALPKSDQAYLAEMLEQGLTEGQFASRDIVDAWSQEINRRIAAYDLGETASIGFEQSLEHLRMAIAEHRGRLITP